MQILFYNCTFYIHNNPITWIVATLHNVFVEIIAVAYKCWLILSPEIIILWHNMVLSKSEIIYWQYLLVHVYLFLLIFFGPKEILIDIHT